VPQRDLTPEPRLGKILPQQPPHRQLRQRRIPPQLAGALGRANGRAMLHGFVLTRTPPLPSPPHQGEGVLAELRERTSVASFSRRRRRDRCVGAADGAKAQHRQLLLLPPQRPARSAPQLCSAASSTVGQRNSRQPVLLTSRRLQDFPRAF